MKYLVSCFFVLPFITSCVAQNQNDSSYRNPPHVELRPSFEPQQFHGYQPKVGPSTNNRYHRPLNLHHHSSRVEKNHGHQEHFEQKGSEVVISGEGMRHPNPPVQSHSKNSDHQKAHNGSHY